MAHSSWLRTLAPVLALLLLGLAIAGWWWTQSPRPPLAVPQPESVPADPAAANPTPLTAEFVGSQTCASCHTEQHSAWQASQHAHAMAHASVETVLGDFNDQHFDYAGVRSRFSQRDGRFFVNTDGPDGSLSEFEVLYTFGLEPLQQYLVDLGAGRLQALSIAWDTRSAEQGGQRWFHIYPDEAISHADPLHWTRPSQNWNFMCADCHVTDFRKQYDAQNDSFASSWAELGVGCEACHGPGSAHLAWATGELEHQDQGLLRQFSERRDMHWLYELERVTARRSVAPGERTEQVVCAQCHSMRSQVAEGFQHGGALLDHYRPELLRDPLYHADGQQREEVFISASFAQSRMHAAGVTCSDCHEPHSQRLRADGNALCATCHSPRHFDQPSHHFHPPGSSGAQCVNCHMPQTTYMVIDPRRDHQLSVPRPDLTQALGTPNACSGCHSDQTSDWAAQQIESWFPSGQWRQAHFASAFAAADAGDPTAQTDLQALVRDPALAPVVRASAARRLLPGADPQAWALLAEQLRSDDPLLRQGALEAFENAPQEPRRQWLPALLDDPQRSLRASAARLLADVPVQAARQPAFTRALAEYEAELRLHADRADYLNQFGLLRLRQGRVGEAEQYWDQALRRDPLHSASRLNLADLLRAQGRELAVDRLLRDGLLAQPQEGLLHYALGLSLVRQQRSAEAIAALRQAYRLRPEDPRMGYVLAVALESQRPEEALSLLAQASERHPFDRNLLWAGASFSARHQQLAAARDYAERLLVLEPEHPGVRQLLRQLPAPDSGR